LLLVVIIKSLFNAADGYPAPVTTLYHIWVYRIWKERTRGRHVGPSKKRTHNQALCVLCVDYTVIRMDEKPGRA